MVEPASVDRSSAAAGAASGLTAARVQRPWGWFEDLGSGEGYKVKRLCIKAGSRLSLQRHRHRLEHWVVVSGLGQLECDGAVLDASAGTTLLVPCGAVHRACATTADLVIVEVQRGDWLSEDDIERLADDFGRCTGEC